MTSPTISLIIPVHNAVPTLDACVRSILSQSYPHFECILVENGSSDESEALCRQYCTEDSRIRLVVSETAGASTARNLGLSVASGDIIGFCDADDLLEPNALAVVAATFAEHPDSIGVFGAFYAGIETPTGLEKRYRGLPARRLSVEEAIGLTIGHDNVMGSVWNKYYRTEAVDGVLFDPSLSHSEDTHFNITLLSRVGDGTVMLISEPLYCYVQYAQSVTHQYHRLFDENDELKYNVALRKILQNEALGWRLRSLVKMRMAILAVDHLPLEISRAQRAKLKKTFLRNLPYFLRHITRYHFKKNAKRLVKAVFLMFK